MFTNTLDPVLFTLGPLAIRWYGLVYVAGFLGAWWALKRFTTLRTEEAERLIFWMAIGLLLGSRAFFFAFYRPDLFSVPAFFAVWEGGMSFHGGLLGVTGGAWLWARRNKKDFWKLADVLAIVAACFLALGRIANFINSEIVGTITDAAWCVEFPLAQPPDNIGCRHPVQLYAAAKNLVIAGMLVLLARTRRFKAGFVFWIFVLSYGALRFLIQFYRADPVIFLGLQTGHLLCLALLFVSVTVLSVRHRDDLGKLFKQTPRKKRR